MQLIPVRPDRLDEKGSEQDIQCPAGSPCGNARGCRRCGQADVRSPVETEYAEHAGCLFGQVSVGPGEDSPDRLTMRLLANAQCVPEHRVVL